MTESLNARVRVAETLVRLAYLSDPAKPGHYSLAGDFDGEIFVHEDLRSGLEAILHPQAAEPRQFIRAWDYYVFQMDGDLVVRSKADDSLIGEVWFEHQPDNLNAKVHYWCLNGRDMTKARWVWTQSEALEALIRDWRKSQKGT